jgi:Kef-type K+ transport system membrane component KefB
MPQLLGMLLGYLLRLNFLGVILLGSAFASHTLIAFPIVVRYGVTRNEAIAVTAGATVLTDIGAFLVLAVVLGAKSGSLTVTYFLQLFVLLSLFTVLVIVGLPRIGKLFFRRSSGRAVEFQFVIVVLFVAAFLAELIGVHEVVGAFLAGLGINATIPRHSPVTSHVLFIGESLFIPVFLLYSGMITDPLSFLKNSDTIRIAAGVTAVAYVSKFIAAWITGRLFRYSRDEFWTTFGLSHAQAAVTIPTLVIGLNLGLFSPDLFNAAILMILLTSISSPLIVNHFAPRLPTLQPGEEPAQIFRRILVPVIAPRSQEYLVSLAALLAQDAHGKVMALSVAQDGGQAADDSFTVRQERLGHLPEILNDPEVEIELISRLAITYAQGILHTARERDATLIMMGWRGKSENQGSIMGSVLDEVMWGSDAPVLVGRLTLPINSMRQVVGVLPARIIPPAVLRRILDVDLALARVLNVPLKLLVDTRYTQAVEALLAASGRHVPVTRERLDGQLQSNRLHEADKDDIYVMPGYGSRLRFASSMGNLPEQMAAAFDGNLLILHFDR